MTFISGENTCNTGTKSTLVARVPDSNMYMCMCKVATASYQIIRFSYYFVCKMQHQWKSNLHHIFILLCVLRTNNKTNAFLTYMYIETKRNHTKRNETNRNVVSLLSASFLFCFLFYNHSSDLTSTIFPQSFYMKKKINKKIFYFY